MELVHSEQGRSCAASKAYRIKEVLHHGKMKRVRHRTIYGILYKEGVRGARTIAYMRSLKNRN